MNGQTNPLILLDDEQVLFFNVEVCRHQYRFQGNHAHDLGTHNAYLQFGSLLFDRFVQFVNGGHGIVIQIHGDLGHVVLVHKPAHALNQSEPPRFLRAAARLPQVEGNAMGLIGSAHEVDIVGDQKIARPHCRGAPGRNKLSRSEVRLPGRVLEPFSQAFVFTLADIGKFAAVIFFGGMLI